ncbi:MAG: PilZ domain-containing protein [Planctomycetota bacterium]|nr:PilZ domain-containing protein [Planctomycetota bacterium]
MAKTSNERRSHVRVAIPCLAAVFDRAGRAVATSRTKDLSDGGALLHVPVTVLPEIGSRINVTISIPRATKNSRLLEDFAAPARVVRHASADEAHLSEMAIEFENPLHLMLEA